MGLGPTQCDKETAAALRAEHGEIAVLTVDGQQFVTRMPELAELTKLRADPSLRGQKKFVAACVVWPGEDALSALLRARGGLFNPMCDAIVAASGKDSKSLTILDEDEIPEGPMAEAYAAETARDFAGKLHALSYSRRKVTHLLLTRDLRGPEVDQLLSGGITWEAGAALVKRVTLWGDAAAIEKTAPGLYMAILDYLAVQAGVGAAVEESEFEG